MKRRLLTLAAGVAAATTVAVGGYYTAGKVSPSDASSGTSALAFAAVATSSTVSVCATATAVGTTVDAVTVPGHDVAVDGATVDSIAGTIIPAVTIPDAVATQCASQTVPTVTETVTATTQTDTTPTTTAPAAFTANLYVGAGGTAGCSRSAAAVAYVASAANVCDTIQTAYAKAASGDVVGVKAGTLKPTNTNANQTGITVTNPNVTSMVTFACADGNTPDTVNWPGNGFNLMIQANWVTFKGACFHIRILHVNSSGDFGLGANHVRIEGVHMDSFQLSGAHNTILKDSTIGPSLSCYGPTGGTAATRCSNWANLPAAWQEVAHYWSLSSSGGSTGEQMEPYIHDRGNGSDVNQCTQNVTIQGDTFKDMQSTDSAVNHQGGLLLDGGACQSKGLLGTVTIEKSQFLHNMTYSIEMDGAFSGSKIQNNWIGQGYGSLGAGGTLNGGENVPRDDGLEGGCRAGVHKVSNMLIRYNSSDGYMSVNGNADSATSGCWTNVRVIGNIMKTGGGACTVPTAVTYAFNVVNNTSGCGANTQAIASFPFVTDTTSLLDYRLTGTPAVQTVPQATGPDYTDTEDFFGNPRASATSAGAVGP